MYQGKALQQSPTQAILSYEREKGRGTGDALRSLRAAALVGQDAIDEVIISFDEADLLGRFSPGYRRGWLVGLDEFNAERNDPLRFHGVDMMPVEES